MAKCLRVVGQGIPVRMSDADALQIVERDGDGEYCDKAIWKARRASDYCVKEDDNCLRRLAGDKIVKTDTLHFNEHRKRARHGG